MKMYDVGHKMSMDMSVSSKESKNKKSYPTLYLSDKELPILKGKDVKDKINLIIECEIVGLNMRKNNNDKEDKGTSYDLEIKRAGEESETKMSQAIEKATED